MVGGEADFFKDGGYNFVCDLCGRKQKNTRAMHTWNGLYVCRHHKEIRNPQDFLRGVKDNQSLPWSRPKIPEQTLPWENSQIDSGGSAGSTTALLDTSGFPISDTDAGTVYDTQNFYPYLNVLDSNFILDESIIGP